MPDNLNHFRIGVYALIFDEGRVLMAHRRDIDWWNLPGGGMEIGDVRRGFCREVREETGLEVQVERLVGVYSRPQKQEVVLTFRCKVIGQVTDYRRKPRLWVFLPHALPRNTLPKHRERIFDALLNQEAAVLRDQRTSTLEDQQLEAFSGIFRATS